MSKFAAGIRIIPQRIGAFLRRQVPYIVALTCLLAIGFIVFIDNIVISIAPGELGVLWRRLGGGTQIDTVYREGLHLILPFNKMYLYSIRRQQLTDTIDVLTVDGLTVKVQYTARYYLSGETLPLMHQRIGPDYVEVIVRPEIRGAIRSIFGQFKPEEIYTSQKAIQEHVTDLARRQLEARYIALDDVPIQNIELPASISEAIEAKMVYQQVEGEYAYRLSIAGKEAERLRIESDGIRVYNMSMAQSLTPSVLRWHGIRATEELAKSPNSKVVVIGAGETGMPIILGKE
ncbi:MAG TPA: prohibitin family protein [Patescibacteria group bacterium]|nr:prohibitin family protein [Patescibacteria group bacterium]